MPQLIVFDWDGTLADSVSKIVECKHFLARKHSLPLPSEQQIRNVLGMKFQLAMAQCFPTVSESLLQTICDEFQALMRQENYQAELFPGAREMLKSLQQHKIKLAVATSKSRSELDTALAHTEAARFFDITCCGAEHKDKPAPDMLNHIMKHLGASPSECLMVGDTVIDIEFANNAAVEIVCVTFGAHSKEKLQSRNPKALITNFVELTRIAKQLAIA